MRRLATLSLLALVAASCGGAPETVTEAASALYVDVASGGHGPFPCTGAIPTFDYADAFDAAGYGGNCARYRADFDSGTGHPGLFIPFRSPIRSIRFSPQFTSAYVCTNQCNDGQYVVVGSGQDLPGFSWRSGTASSIVLGTVTPCPPPSPSWTSFTVCQSPYSPEDGSGFLTFVLGDGFGHSLNQPNNNSLAGDCEADAAAYGFPFTPPSGYQFGTRGVAVYTCHP